MTRDEFAELVDWVFDRWGIDEVWANSGKFAADFEPFDGADVWDAVNRHAMSADSGFAPKPTDLKRRVVEIQRERYRYDPPAQIPETVDGYRWSEYSRRTYGEVIPIGEAIRRTHAELPVDKCPHPDGCDLHGGTADPESAFSQKGPG